MRLQECSGYKITLIWSDGYKITMTLNDALVIIDKEMSRTKIKEDFSTHIKLHFIKQHILEHGCLKAGNG